MKEQSSSKIQGAMRMLAFRGLISRTLALLTVVVIACMGVLGYTTYFKIEDNVPS